METNELFEDIVIVFASFCAYLLFICALPILAECF